jgi:hypothetical protein
METQGELAAEPAAAQRAARAQRFLSTKEHDAKVEKLNQQIAKAEGDLKKKLQKALDDLKADYARRKENLKQAGKFLAEALK